LVGAQALQSPGIGHVVQLEQWLMEGAYNKVLDARPKLPDPSYEYFMEKLLSTVRYRNIISSNMHTSVKQGPALGVVASLAVCMSWCHLVSPTKKNGWWLDAEGLRSCRDEIAECSEHAYTTISLADAKKLMLFQSDKEAAAYATEVKYPIIQLRVA
jgi:hypothetical protein